MTRRIILNLPPQTWEGLRKSMLDARLNGSEAFGVCYCRRQRLSRRAWRLLPVDWVVPMPDCYESQGLAGLALKQGFHLELLRRYGNKGLDVVHFHTHPTGERPGFSWTDDRAESQYSRFLSRLPGTPRLLSGVFDNQLGQATFRAWRPDGTVAADQVVFTAEWLRREPNSTRPLEAQERFDRQSVFGLGFQRVLNELRVGLVGCGGIGACFAEQLARLGVRRWVLVDPDHLEMSNLNRLPGATPTMVGAHWSKVQYVEHLIRQSWSQHAEVRTMSLPIECPDLPAMLGTCDLIAVATDNHHSRMVCQEIALQFMRPLLSMATHIEFSENQARGCRFLSRVTAPPLGGGWCLMCGDVVDATQAALETASSDIVSVVAKAGYLPGVPAPAVYWTNSSCASLGVYAIHGLLAGLLDASKGLDWVLEFGQKKWLEIGHEMHDKCLYCSADGHWDGRQEEFAVGGYGLNSDRKVQDQFVKANVRGGRARGRRRHCRK